MKVLICGDSLISITGLNEIAVNIFKYFKSRGHDVAYLSIFGSEFFPEETCLEDEKLYQTVYDQKSFDMVIEDYKPNLIFSIHDPWNLDKIAFSSYRDTYKWVCYCPIEGEYYSSHIIYPDSTSFRKSLTEIFNECDLIIPYTEMGKAVLSHICNKEIISDKLYNGVENLCLSDVNRNEVFKGLVNDDDFLFMTTGANFQRKGLAYIIEAFYKFLSKQKEKTKFKLYIHGQLDTYNSGTDIKSFVKDFNLTDNIIYSNPQIQISKQELYERYKCADCCIGLPLAEGFGLGFAEAMINKIPIIAHDYGGHIEYIPEYLKVPSIVNYYPNNHFCIWKIPNIEEAVRSMEYIVKNKDKYNYTEENHVFAKLNLTWENIYLKLDTILKPIISNYTDDIIHTLNIQRVI